MGSPPFRIEILTEISGVEFGRAWDARQPCTVDDVTFGVDALAHLPNKPGAAEVRAWVTGRVLARLGR